MQLQALNNQTFTAAKASKEQGSKRRANIDAAIALSDKDLRNAAYYMASVQTDDDKHRKINSVAIASLPFVAAVRDTVLTRGMPTAFLNGAIASSPAARALTGMKTFAKWSGALALSATVVGGTQKLAEKSDKFRQFVKDNPFTTMVAELGTTIAAYNGVKALMSKVTEKILGKEPVKTWHRVGEFAVKFNDNKVVKNVAKNYVKVADKMHPALKAVGKLGLAFAPLAIAAGGIMHTFNHNSVRNRQAMENYTNMKVAQSVLAYHRNRELQGIDK